MHRFLLMTCALILVPAGLAVAQLDTIHLEISSGGSLPFAPRLENGQDLYKIGPFIYGTAGFPIAPARGIYGLTRIGFQTSGTYTDNPLSLITISPGVEYQLQLGRIVIAANALTGAYAAVFDGASAFDLAVQGGPSFRFLFSPRLSAGISASYMHLFADTFRRSLYSGLQVTLGASFSLGTGGSRPSIEHRDIEIRPIFPVFFAFYDSNPLGELGIRNSTTTELHDIQVEFYVPEYMDRPKACASFTSLRAGQNEAVPLYALFNRSILSTTEGTRIPAEIRISYTHLGARRTVEIGTSLDIRNRNAMTWDDDRKAASFVTARDEDVLRFARSTASFVRDTESRIVNSTFRIAMALFRALDVYGVRYVIDPVTPHESFSQNSAAEDYLQFPGQTLSFRGGDCDDLSILYSALLESVGIETAFVTVPGHIYLAFNTQVEPGEVETVFANTDELIIAGGKTWVPVEVTMIRDNFLAAWREGARMWKMEAADGEALLIPVRSAWQVYKPVDQPPLSARVIPFNPAEIAAGYRADLAEVTAFQIQGRIRELELRIARGGSGQASLINRLGTLYGRYGLYDQAKRQFLRIADSGYAPAIINLGNISYLEGDYKRALRYYEQALKIDGSNALALIGLARANYELGDYSAANATYKRVEQSDPGIASGFRYLASTHQDDQTRASSQEIRQETVVWGN